MSDARRKSLLWLTAEVLRLRLMQANLVSTGNKWAPVERLLEYEDSISRGDGDPSSSDDSETDDSEAHSSGSVSVSPDGSSRNPDNPGPSGLSIRSRATRCRYYEAASQPDAAVSGDESQSAASNAAVLEDGDDPEGPPTRRRRRRATASSTEAAVSRAAEEGTGDPPTRRRRRRATASSTEAAVSRAAEEGTGDPPTRCRRRRATASSTEYVVPRAAENGSRAPPTRHNPKAHCSRRLEHRSEHGSSTTMADKDAVTSTHRRKTAIHEVVEQLGPRKASPFVARCRPSHSRSYSPRSHRRRRHSSYSDDSSDSRSSRSSKSSSSSRHRSRRRSRRRHQRRSSGLEEFSESPFSSCVTAPARYLVQKIRQGKFDRLLPPVLDMPLTAKTFRAILRFHLKSLGFNPSLFNTHSLRIGAATAAAKAGMSSSTIMELGRRRSAAFHSYVRHHPAHPLRCCSDGKGSLTELVCAHFSPHLYSLMYMYGPKTNLPRVWPVCTILGGSRACIWGLIWAEPCGLVPTKPASQAWTSVRLEQYREARHGSRIGGWCPNDPNRMSIYTQTLI